MRILTESVVAKYTNFLLQYYPLKDLKICITEANEKEWRLLYTAIQKGGRIIEDMAEKQLLESKTFGEVWESHGTRDDVSYNDALGYFTTTNNLLAIINLWKKNQTTDQLKDVLKGSEFFVMLRISYLKDRALYLDALFHEILHTIELKTQIRVFRGSSIEQEARDTKEIVLPYVREFIRDQKNY